MVALTYTHLSKLLIPILMLSLSKASITNNSTIDMNTLEESLNMIELTDKTFDKVSENNNLIVLYRAKKCKPCSQYRELFLKIAKVARDNYNYTIAKLDVDLYENLFNRLEARNKGVLRLIRKGMSPGFAFYGEPTFDNMLIWFNKFKEPSLLTRLNSVKEVEEFAKDQHLVVYLGNTNHKAYYTFDEVAEGSYNIRFGFCDVQECLDKYEVDDGGLVYFNGNQISKLKPGYEIKDINKFIASSSLNLVNDGSDSVISKIGLIQMSTVIIYADSGEDLAPYRNLLSNILKKRNDEQKKPQLLGIVTSYMDQCDKLKHTFQVKSHMTPTVFILHMENQPKKYKLEDNTFISEESVSEFVNNYSENKLSPYYFSEDAPNKENELEDGILKVVSETFYKKVIDNRNDVMLFVYVPWCGYCQQFKNIFESLRRKTKYSDKLVLAKIDASQNEIDPKFIPKINGYPLIAFWKGNDKKKYIEFTDDRQIYLLQNFINKHGTYVASVEDDL